MERVIDFLYYYMRFEMRKNSVKAQNVRHFFESHKKYAGSTVYSAADIGEILYELIKSGTPFMAGRLGATELSALKTFDFKVSTKYSKILQKMWFEAGLFPKTEEMGKAFGALMLESIPCADVMGVWGQPFEEYYLRRYGSAQVKLTYLLDLEPWSCAQKPWSAALEGKKVLMIHPLVNTIQRQYAQREKIYPGTDILPEFELKVLKSVLTIAGEKDERFSDWFAALDWMYQEAMKIDFDVAIIGCGSYGFPLAAKLKCAGKQAIHLGGVTQLLYGIKGKRWEENPAFGYIQKYFNDSWTRPDETEKPKRALEVEGGCYW